MGEGVRRAGYDVAEAANGEEGLHLILKEKIDLVILDIMMPKKDGWQVCKSLKTAPKTKDIPVVVLTARKQSIDELRTWECGADDYVTKPVDHVRLMSIVRGFLPQGEDPNGT